MTTATAKYLADPLTLVGTERMTADRGTTGVTGGTITQDIANLFKGTRGASIASAATVDLSAATGSNLHVTGTTTITALGTASAGVERRVIFDGALTLTHNATNLILPGSANITTAAGDSAVFTSEGSGNWRCTSYSRADGTPVSGSTFTGGSLTSAVNEARGTAIASAATTDIGAAGGNFVHVTGTTTITALGTIQAGTRRVVTFDGALTLTHNATSLILPGGANINTAANDCATFESEGSGNWRCVSYQKASGLPTVTPGGEIIAEPVNALTNSSGTVAINCALGDYFTLSLTANVTSITFSNLPASGKAQTLMLEIKQDATGSRTATWPSSFKWAGASSGALSTAANSVDVLAITTFDQGTTWRATLAKGFA